MKQIKEEGRTREWVARFCGLTVQSINGYLSGRNVPPKPVVKLMALALNTTEAYLMGEDRVLNQKEVNVGQQV